MMRSGKSEVGRGKSEVRSEKWVGWQHHHPARRNRGTILTFITCLIPIAMMLTLTTLTRVDISLAETRRHQQRVQARLLAQSALTLYQTSLTGKNIEQLDETIEGVLEGFGTYHLSVDRGEAGNRSIKAHGAAAGRNFQMIHEMDASALQSPDLRKVSTLMIHRSTQRLEQIPRNQP